MYLFIVMLVMAIVTYLPRVVPIVFFNKKIKSIYIQSFLHYVPFAVLGAMTFPHIFYATHNMLYAGLGTLTALILGYFGRSLLSVAMITVGVVYCCNLFL